MKEPSPASRTADGGASGAWASAWVTSKGKAGESPDKGEKGLANHSWRESTQIARGRGQRAPQGPCVLWEGLGVDRAGGRVDCEDWFTSNPGS